MKRIAILTTLLMLAAALTMELMAAVSTVEILLNNYMRDQATKQVELLMPRGKFSLSVQVSVDQNKIRAESEIQPVKMPLGSSFITGTDLKASGATEVSLERMLGYIKKIDAKVSVAPDISPQLRDMIKGSLMSVLSMDARRGDKVEISNLPEGFTSVWAAAQDAAAQAQIWMKPAAAFALVLGVMLLLATFLLWFAFRSMSARLAGEARHLSSTLKDAIETGSVGSPGASQVGAAQSHAPQVAAPSEGVAAMGEKAISEFWEKVDLDLVAAFCRDAMDHQRYTSVPVALMNTVLSPERSAELEKKLPQMSLESFLGSTSNLKSNEITQLFQQNQSEYRRATRSPLVQQVLGVDVDKLAEFMAGLEKMEAAILVNSLTPLRRTVVLKKVPTALKMELAQVASRKMSAVEHKQAELSLTDKISSLGGPVRKEEEAHSLDYLTALILKAESFEEDEQMYKHVQGGGPGEYAGPLKALDLFTEKDWNECNLQEIAIAFHGYSAEVREAVVAKFTGKKVEWLKNFMAKYESSPHDFVAPDVQNVHEMLKNRISSKADAELKHEGDDSAKAA